MSGIDDLDVILIKHLSSYKFAKLHLTLSDMRSVNLRIFGRIRKFKMAEKFGFCAFESLNDLRFA